MNLSKIRDRLIKAFVHNVLDDITEFLDIHTDESLSEKVIMPYDAQRCTKERLQKYIEQTRTKIKHYQDWFVEYRADFRNDKLSQKAFIALIVRLKDLYMKLNALMCKRFDENCDNIFYDSRM